MVPSPYAVNTVIRSYELWYICARLAKSADGFVLTKEKDNTKGLWNSHSWNRGKYCCLQFKFPLD